MGSIDLRKSLFMKRLLLLQIFILKALWIPAQQPAGTGDSEQWFSRSREQIRVNEEKMMFEENLQIFREGHRKGFFYFLHPAIPRCKPYLDFSEFEALVEADRELHQEALEQARTIYQVQIPTGYSPEYDYPLFIIFHGGNSNLQKVKMHWKEESLDQQFIKVYLQSYRCFDSESYTWRSGDPRSDNDLLGIYNEIMDAYPIDSSRVVVAGISAGANYAIGMALRGVIPVSGFLAFCPGLPGEMQSDNLLSDLRSDIRGYILGGEYDFYLEEQAKLTKVFDQMGLEYLYLIEEQMYHQYPEDESMHIRRGLEFISGRE